MLNKIIKAYQNQKHKIAVHYRGENISAERFIYDIEMIRKNVQKFIAKKGSSVAIFSQNPYNVLVLYLSLNSLNNNVFLIDPRASANELVSIVMEYEIEYVICDTNAQFDKSSFINNVIFSCSNFHFMILQQYFDEITWDYADIGVSTVFFSSGTTFKPKAMAIA